MENLKYKYEYIANVRKKSETNSNGRMYARENTVNKVIESEMHKI